jgi:outer membrane protein assembly factor BamB
MPARDTGLVLQKLNNAKIEWDDKPPLVAHGAAAVTNNVVSTTTYNGYLYAFNAATGAILLKTPLSAGTNAPSPSTATTSSWEQASH